MQTPHNFRTHLEFYWKGYRHIEKLAEEYTQRVEKEALRKKAQSARLHINPCICFSRNIAAGALDVALIAGQRLGWQVIDREMIEYICKKSQLSRQSIATFDERYPGLVKEFMCLLLGDRPFGMNAYSKDLFIVSYFLAATAPAIFVGRGIHLMLPRNKTLAVRCISSRKARIQRLSEKLATDPKSAEQTLDQADREQREFFLRVHGKKDAPPEEFDMILNLDRIVDPQAAADAVLALLKSRFGDVRG